MNFFATTPKGLELLLVDELRQLGAIDASEKLAGVTFSGDLALAYKACLWSRLANRILLQLTKIPAETPEELYAGVQTIAWDEHINPSGTLHVNFVCSQSKMTHSLYGAQKVKDAIVDQLREKYDMRPSVTNDQPDVAIHVYLYRDTASISIDLSGESLHKRGYRLEQGAAPLKENLAAAILMRAKWQEIASAGGMLVDPMCGSGTLLIEAALMAGNIAPGLSRTYFGFQGWKKHDAELWETILADATQKQNLAQIPQILGYDADPYAIKISFANIERAGLHGKIHVEKNDLENPLSSSALLLEEKAREKKTQPGLLVTNPPYGERLGDLPDLQKLYETLGNFLKKNFEGWHAAVFTGNPDLAKTMGIRAYKHYALFNGPIPCQLLLFNVIPEKFIDRSPEANNERRIRQAKKSVTEADLVPVQMFINRLQKNLKHIKRQAQRANISCYRVYDADLPEYAVVIDFYGDKVLVQEYPAPKSIPKEKAEKRLQSVLAVLPETLNVLPTHIYFRVFSEYRSVESEFPDFKEIPKVF